MKTEVALADDHAADGGAYPLALSALREWRCVGFSLNMRMRHSGTYKHTHSLRLSYLRARLGLV